MTARLGAITFDCQDPIAMATFWSETIGRPIDDEPSEFFASIGMTTPDAGPRWLFAQVPEGKTAKNRCHLDLEADDPTAEVERLVTLGATHLASKDEWNFQWNVLQDPEGNEFCVSRPH